MKRFPQLVTAGALCALAAACADLPTEPRSYVQEADGALWVAVMEPAGMPDARTWLPYLSPESAGEVRALHAGAARARRAGEAEMGMALEADAGRLAASRIAAAPPPQLLLGAMAALEIWTERALERTQTGRFPELDSAAARVRAHREGARVLLARGDTGAAVAELERGAREARHFSPTAVGLRLVSRIEARIDADPAPSTNLKRARRLLGTAREALATGDGARALKRALYALQLVEMEERLPPSTGRRPASADSAPRR